MTGMRYDAVVPGERDLAIGDDFMADLSGKLPLLSCNLAKDDESFGRKSLVLERGGLKIGLVGATAVRGPGRIPPGWKADDPEMRLREVAAEMRDEVDLLMGLLHVGLEEGRRLAAELQEFDLIVLGHDGRKLVEPLLVGRTVVVKGESQGRSIGRIDLYREDGGQLRTGNPELIPLGSDIADNSGMKVYLEKYDEGRERILHEIREKRGDAD